MSLWDKVFKSESLKSDKWCNFFFISHKFPHNLFYNILLHFKSFNQVAFASYINVNKKFFFLNQGKVSNDQRIIFYQFINWKLPVYYR